MNIQKNHPSAVWAIDLNEIDLIPSRSGLEQLKDYRIYPVSVLDKPNPSDEKKIHDFLKGFSARNLEEPTLLKNKGSHQTPQAQVIAFAEDKKASVIALTSHGRKGIKRILLGGFAEKLLDHSPIPVLFLTTQMLTATASHRAIFATDFSLESKIAFKKFLEFAKHSVNEVIIFHADLMPVQMYAAYEVAGVPLLVSPSLDHEITEENQEANLWIQEISTPHVGIRLHAIVKGNSASVSRGIIDACKKEKIGLIGITSEKGTFEKALRGSVAQELFRHQTGLVWVSNSTELSRLNSR
jgi:nucleotide-binding universal stress UspA family protein